MKSPAIVLHGPGKLSLETLALTPPGRSDAVVQVRHSGISTGTEKLFWTGGMPPFPGMGYPLVPGYEAVGEVVEAPAASGLRAGDTVFVPGASCFTEARGLFGASAKVIVADAARVTAVDASLGREATLLALAATARHAIAGLHNRPPELITGHGTVGRLLARLTIAAGAPPPTVWESDPARRGGARGYEVLDPADDPRSDYGCICEATGDAGILDSLVARLCRGGEIVLAGFYPGRLDLAFAPAFIKEARLRIAAEWTPQDMQATRALIGSGALALDGLITHHAPAAAAETAYRTAFEDPACLKMVLDWEDA